MTDRLDLGGVQPLGEKRAGVVRDKRPQRPVGEARMREEMTQQERDLETQADALLAMGATITDLEAERDEALEDAQRLWQALHSTVALLRETLTDVDADVYPPEVERAGLVMLELEKHRPVEVVCPECVSGKHPNCTHEVMLEDDRMVPCICETQQHAVYDGGQP